MPIPTRPNAAPDAASVTPSPFEEFRLRERDAASGEAPEADERLEAARRLLRATWPVSTDTFVTGDLPLLLTRASRIDPRR